MVINWTDRAKQHLRNIHDYYADVAEDNVAGKLAADISNAARPLANFPEMAAREPALVDYPQVFRSLIVRKSYKIIYFVANEIVHIVAVWDCRQNPDKLKGKVLSSKMG
ncbi:hypothetical protein FACS1894195_0190 [Bacteroidia bacterium]|nr:hypothetical protein FACS1894195_0190 [Bacteroidia bacterium]